VLIILIVIIFQINPFRERYIIKSRVRKESENEELLQGPPLVLILLTALCQGVDVRYNFSA